MAYTATVLLEGLASVRDSAGLGFQENELRRSKYGALEMYSASTEAAIPKSELERLKTSSARSTSIDTFVREADGSGTSRACSGSGTGTTARTALTYNVISEEFAISHLEHDNNEVRMQEAFNNKLQQKLRSMHTRVDTACVANAEANISTSATRVGSIYTTFVANAARVSLADHQNYFNNVSVEMQEEDFNAPYWNLASTSQKALIRNNRAQGADNGTNLAFQDEDYSHFTSNRVTNGAGVLSTSYMLTQGTIGIISHTNSLHRDGKVEGAHTWDSFDDPFGLLGKVELKAVTSCADTSGVTAGAQADLVTSYVLSYEFSLVNAYTSTANTGIYKYELLTT